MPKNLLFSSVGDRSRFPEYWLDHADEREFDLWISYYGDGDGHRFEPHVDRFFQRKGFKFQNFNHVFQHESEALEAYDSFFIIDDDIQIGTREINRLFAMRASHELEILQPAFAPPSRISHACTEKIPGALLHYTNFIEVTAPMFSKTALWNLMHHFDDRLIGWGIDYLAMWANGTERISKYAVIDAVSCVNPNPPAGEKREVEKNSDVDQRIQRWLEVKHALGIPDVKQIVHSVVLTPRDYDEYKTHRPAFDAMLFPKKIASIRLDADRVNIKPRNDSGENIELALNESARAILGLCNGNHRAREIANRLIKQLGIDSSEASYVRQQIYDALKEFERLAVLKFNYMPG